MFIFKLMFKNKITIKGILLVILKVICLIYIYRNIFLNIFWHDMTRHHWFGGYKYMTYDLCVNGCSKEFLEKEETKAHVESSLKINYIYIPVSNPKKELEIQVDGASAYQDSLNEIFDIIPKKLFLDYDNKIIKEGNGIFLSYGVAYNLNVKVGDMVQILDLKYKLAGIFEPCVGIAVRDMFMLDKEFPKGPKDPYYTTTYVKLKDFNKGLEYFKNNQYDEKYFYLKYGEEWEKYVSQEEKDENKASFKTPEMVLHDIRKDSGRHNPYRSIPNVALSIIAFLTANIYTYYKYIQINKSKLALLRVAGYPKYKIYLFFMFASLLEHLAIMTVVVYYIKSNFALVGIAVKLILAWYGVFLLLTLVASIISGLVALVNIRDNDLVLTISEERV